MRAHGFWLYAALAATALAAALSASAAPAAEKSAADDWYVEGGGYAQKDIVRVSLNTNGGLLIESEVADGVEYITGYEAWGELNASKLNINAWRYEGEYEFPEPIKAGSFNPTLGEPYSLPPFTIDGLTYSVVLTRADAGTVKISGYVDIDVAGRTEINADCAIWRQGTPKPEIPDTESGCDAGAGAPALFALGAALLGRRHTRR